MTEQTVTIAPEFPAWELVGSATLLPKAAREPGKVYIVSFDTKFNMATEYVKSRTAAKARLLEVANLAAGTEVVDYTK
jgi:hypothetical protein